MIKTKNITLTALFSAMIFVTTMFVHLPVPMMGGYVHIGDAFIYLAACLLPAQYAIFASAIGAGLADAIAFPVYIIPTIIIKSLIVLAFSKNNNDKIISIRSMASVIVGSVTGIAGYFLADWIIFGNAYTALLNAVAGFVQPLASALIFVVLGYALDRVNFKKRFLILPIILLYNQALTCHFFRLSQFHQFQHSGTNICQASAVCQF